MTGFEGYFLFLSRCVGNILSINDQICLVFKFHLMQSVVEAKQCRLVSVVIKYEVKGGRK
mgnify:FL=1